MSKHVVLMIAFASFVSGAMFWAGMGVTVHAQAEAETDESDPQPGSIEYRLQVVEYIASRCDNRVDQIVWRMGGVPMHFDPKSPDVMRNKWKPWQLDKLPADIKKTREGWVSGPDMWSMTEEEFAAIQEKLREELRKERESKDTQP